MSIRRRSHSACGEMSLLDNDTGGKDDDYDFDITRETHS